MVTKINPKVTPFRTTRAFDGPRGFTFVLASLTVPDDSLSIAELLLNHSRPQLKPVFDETAEIRDPRTYDIVEIDMMRKDLEARKLVVYRDAQEESKRNLDAKTAAAAQAIKDAARKARQERRDKLVERQLGG